MRNCDICKAKTTSDSTRKQMPKAKFDGKVGKYYYRAGRTAGCYNLFRKRDKQWKFWKAIGLAEFDKLCKNNT